MTQCSCICSNCGPPMMKRVSKAVLLFPSIEHVPAFARLSSCRGKQLRMAVQFLCQEWARMTCRKLIRLSPSFWKNINPYNTSLQRWNRTFHLRRDQRADLMQGDTVRRWVPHSMECSTPTRHTCPVAPVGPILQAGSNPYVWFIF